MSETTVNAEVRFKSKVDKEAFFNLLSELRGAGPKAKRCRRAIAILKSIGIDGRAFVYCDGSDTDIPSVERGRGNSIRFRLFGGVNGCSIFWQELFAVIVESNPRDVVAVEFNDQVGECILHLFDGAHTKEYHIGDPKWDRLLNSKVETIDGMEIVRLAKSEFLKKAPKNAKKKTAKKRPATKTTRKVRSALEGEYQKRKGKFYWWGGEIRDADVESFTILDQLWATDKKNIFFKGDAVKADRRTFRVLNACFAKDKRQVWCVQGLVKGVDAKSFEALDNGQIVDYGWEYPCGYAGDKNGVYFYHMDYDEPHPVEGADRRSFQTIGFGLGRDKNQVYWRSMAIKKADPKSFELLQGEFSRDANQAYYGTQSIKGAVASSFRVLESKERQPSFSFALDEHHVYYGDPYHGCMVLEGADPAQFRALDRSWGTDGRRHYQFGNRKRKLPRKYA